MDFQNETEFFKFSNLKSDWLSEIIIRVYSFYAQEVVWKPLKLTTSGSRDQNFIISELNKISLYTMKKIVYTA